MSMNQRLLVLVLAKLVATDVLTIWNKASIPTISYANVLQSLERLIDTGKELQKYPPAKRTSSTFQQGRLHRVDWSNSVKAMKAYFKINKQEKLHDN